MRTLHISDDAEVDTDKIWWYIAQDNPSAADALLATFHEKFLVLIDFPHMGFSCAEIRPSMRCLVVARDYLVFYRPEPTQIVILRVMHGQRDLEAIWERY